MTTPEYAPQLAEYYLQDGEVNVFQGRDGHVEVNKILIRHDQLVTGDVLPEATKSAFAGKITELYSSIVPRNIMVLENGHEYSVELGIIAGEAGGEVVLHGASFQSSLTENYGNGAEAGLKSIWRPDRTHVYASSNGMGISSAMTKAERIKFRKTGKLYETVDGKVVPFPVVTAIAKALFDEGLQITHTSSDSAGLTLMNAYGAAYGDGNIKTSHQNVPTNIWDKTVPELALGTMVVDERRSRRHAAISKDVYRMRTELTDFVEANVGNKYREYQYEPKKDIRMLGTYAVALGRGPKAGDPLVESNKELASANPGIDILLTVGGEDPLAESQRLAERTEDILREVSRRGDGTISSIIFPDASHSLQTHYSQLLAQVVRTVLG